MSQYLILSKIQVQNANAIAGFTWGFPAITGFLGFTHALSRRLSEKYKNLNFGGCAVISNDFQHHTYLDKGDVRFTQRTFGYTFKPIKKDGKQKNPSTIEEGKMNLTVSLVIEINEAMLMTTEQVKLFEQEVKQQCLSMRLAGSSILDIANVKLVSANTEAENKTMLKTVKRLVMPGFVLLDRSYYLQEHFETLKSAQPKAQLLDAWLDYSALIYTANPELQEDEELSEQTKANWSYQPKPHKGYLVPLMTGYKAISELYEPDTVLNVRDTEVPTRFVEAIHSIGEWKGAHAIKVIDDVIWRYHQDDQWYLCQQNINQSQSSKASAENLAEELNQLTEIDILNLI